MGVRTCTCIYMYVCVYRYTHVQFEELMEEKDFCNMYCILEPRAPSK